MKMTPEIHPANLNKEKLLTECKVQRTRRKGPGGQHRNKVETAVVITHLSSGVVGEAGERRSQHENLRNALFRLRVNLALAIRHTVMKDRGPSSLWQQRCQAGKIAINQTHDDFPVLLAEVLDVFQDSNGDMQLTADYFSCTRTQLTKFLKKESQALAQVNQKRSQLNLPPLK